MYLGSSILVAPDREIPGYVNSAAFGI